MRYKHINEYASVALYCVHVVVRVLYLMHVRALYLVHVRVLYLMHVTHIHTDSMGCSACVALDGAQIVFATQSSYMRACTCVCLCLIHVKQHTDTRTARAVNCFNQVLLSMVRKSVSPRCFRSTK